MRGGNKNCTEVQSENLIARDNDLRDLELNGRIILKCVLKTMVASVLLEFSWLIIGFISGLL